jgi:hypothetical protein
MWNYFTALPEHSSHLDITAPIYYSAFSFEIFSLKTAVISTYFIYAFLGFKTGG